MKALSIIFLTVWHVIKYTFLAFAMILTIALWVCCGKHYGGLK